MIKTISVQEASRRSGLGIDNIYGLIQGGRYNWGDCRKKKRWTYLIYEDLFMDWARERGLLDEKAN